MAINLKELIVDSFLELCKEKPLKSITIQDLIKKTGISRQSFYNHFLDKNDLIQFIYLHKIIQEFNTDHVSDLHNFHQSLLDSLYRMKTYSFFLRPALLVEEQNNLKDFMFKHCKEFDLAWHQKWYGPTPMPTELYFATQYHAMASTSMVISWILSNMPTSCEDIAQLITTLRSLGMETLFESGQANPYQNGHFASKV